MTALRSGAGARVVARRRVSSESRRRALGLTLSLPPVLLLAVFVGIPVVLAIGFSLGHNGGLNSTIADIGTGTHSATSWWGTGQAYVDVFTDPRFLRDLGVTVFVTVVSTLLVIATSLAIALNLRLRGGRLATVFAGLAVVPLFIPVVIASWAILTFYSADGFVRTAFALVGLEGPTWGYTTIAVVIGSVWTSLPFATLMATSGLQSVPDAMIEAAKDAGASTRSIVTRILVPLAGIPLVIATTFTAIGILGQFTVPYFTGPNAPTVLGVDISKYFQAFNRPQESAVMAVVVFALASGIAFVYVRANFRSAKKEGRI
ncbi:MULTISPECIES: ABC transporter permease [unclassified Frondihabitans]|uniref:ABC transporter permease n=1 Tax=unclassified Frondihabitans TaxID=2626248 RepID=UPI000F501497|nr:MULTISPECIES: sugar ABC transporter permease [unclassified Frondihabitans]RPE77677.1 carbohydrate ABC transporter membrane protein 1 (CUT1 family) [Frondihabitans sp. PhB153]RPF07954.1 carbohydrate ABC transporter membrane protein 1 (CUT1 family) [Frondihabitans sp. PhB161]